MSDRYYDAAMEKIEFANISPAEYRTAVRLLRIATTGYLDINRERTLAIVGTSAWGTVRRQLIALQSAGIVKKWLNHSTRVWFVAYPPPTWLAEQMADEADEVIATRSDARAGRAEARATRSPTEADDDPDRALHDQMRASDDHLRALDARMRAPDDHPDPATYTHASAQGVELVELSYTNPKSNGISTQLNPPTPQTVAWVADLLTDPEVGVMKRTAPTALRLITADGIVRYVAAWWTEHLYAKSGDPPIKPGLLTWRLTNPDKHHPGPISPEFLASDLYRRHYGRLSALDEPPEWFWSLPAPPADQWVELADGARVRLEGGGR